MYRLYPEQDFILDLESIRDMCNAGRYNRAQIIVLQEQVLTIGAGRSDSIHVYIDDDDLVYVLAINEGLGYVGMEIFDLKLKDKVGDIFLQREEDIGGLEDMLGCDWVWAEHDVLIDTLAGYLA